MGAGGSSRTVVPGQQRERQGPGQGTGANLSPVPSARCHRAAPALHVPARAAGGGFIPWLGWGSLPSCPAPAQGMSPGGSLWSPPELGTSLEVTDMARMWLPQCWGLSNGSLPALKAIRGGSCPARPDAARLERAQFCCDPPSPGCSVPATALTGAARTVGCSLCPRAASSAPFSLQKCPPQPQPLPRSRKTLPAPTLTSWFRHWGRWSTATSRLLRPNPSVAAANPLWGSRSSHRPPTAHSKGAGNTMGS